MQEICILFLLLLYTRCTNLESFSQFPVDLQLPDSTLTELLLFGLISCLSALLSQLLWEKWWRLREFLKQRNLAQKSSVTPPQKAASNQNLRAKQNCQRPHCKRGLLEGYSRVLTYKKSSNIQVWIAQIVTASNSYNINQLSPKVGYAGCDESTLILSLYLLRNTESWHMLALGLIPYNADIPVQVLNESKLVPSI